MTSPNFNTSVNWRVGYLCHRSVTGPSSPRQLACPININFVSFYIHPPASILIDSSNPSAGRRESPIMADVAASRSQARSQSSSPKRPPSLSNSASSRSQTTVRPFELSSESTPLLLRRDDILYGTQPYSRRSSSSSSSRDSPSGRSSKKSDTRLRWPIYASFLSLSISVLGILLFVFAAPAVVKRYAEEAAVFTPRDLSIDSITPHGLRARVQGDFVLNSTRVPGKQARNFGRFTTWVIREVETAPSDVLVYLPEYGNVLVGTASLPVMKLNVRDGLATHVDFLTDLATGDIRGMRSVAMDWLEGRLGRLRLKGSTRMHLKSGLLGLGTHTLSESVTFGGIFAPAVFHWQAFLLLTASVRRKGFPQLSGT